MALRIQKMTVEQFDRWILHPENSGQDYEFIAGEIIDVVSNQYASKIAARILILMGTHILQNRLGDVTGADGGYMVAGERYIPDVGFISRERQPEPSRESYNPNPPDLAVEVISPNDSDRLMTIKVTNYLLAGTVVWVVYPDEKQVQVYVPGQAPHVLDEDGTLEGGEVLPGFTLAVREIFAE